MRSRLIGPLLLVVLAAGLWFVLTRPDGRVGERPDAPSAVGTDASAADPVPQPTASASAPARDRAPDAHTGRPARGEPSDVEPTKSPSADPAIPLRGRVLDVEGQPLAGVRIAARGAEEALGTSDGAGGFAFELPSGESEVVLVTHASSGFATVRAGHVRRGDAGTDHILIAARALALAGTVVDGASIGIEGAEVEVAVPDSLLVAFPFARDRMERVRHRTTTDADGAFALARAPHVDTARIAATHPGHESALEPVPSTDRSDLLLTLPRIATDPGIDVRGVVLFEDGAPAPGASVRFQFHTAVSETDGSFVLRIPEGEELPEQAVALAAGLEGYGPAVVPSFDRVLRDAAPHAPAPLELFLGDAARSIAGRVVDEEGRGRGGWNVRIREGVSVCDGILPVVSAESLAGYMQVQTGDDGAFELGGLLDRDYEVWAYHESTLQAIEADAPVAAGTRDLELVAHRTGLFERVEGVVLSRTGRPVPSARVSVTRVTDRSESGALSVGGASTATDADGRFLLGGVPREGVRLSVGGSDVVPESYDIGARDDPSALTLSVARRCHFQVRVRGAATSLDYSMLDASEKALPLYAFQSNGWSSKSRRAIEESGTTPVLAVSEDAKVLVLWRGGDEVLREPVLFLEDGVTTIEVEAP